MDAVRGSWWNQERNQFWTLDTLPPELFLLICSYLSSKFVIKVLSAVCKRFHEIIQDDSTWKTRIGKKWPKKYPPVAIDNFNWKEACIQREEQYRLWSDWKTNMKTYCLNGAHCADVNVVHFLEGGHILASGSRDYNLKLWSMNKLVQLTSDSEFTPALAETQCNAHRGWIWAMASAGNHLYTGSWDGNVKIWDVGRNCFNIEAAECGSPVLSLACCRNYLGTGTYNKQVLLMDLRVGLKPIFRHANHKRAVLCLVLDEKFIITGSEDKTVVVFDRMAGKVHSLIKLEAFPMSLSYGVHQLWIGDQQGILHLIDPSSGTFKKVQSYKIVHRGKITGIKHSMGSIIASSTDKTIRILEPNLNPSVITELKVSGEVAGISTYDNVLASANSDGSVGIWLPRS